MLPAIGECSISKKPPTILLGAFLLYLSSMWRCSFLLLFSLVLNAQPYGQFKYSHAGVFMTNAFVTALNSKGHLLVGHKPNSLSGTYNFCIDKTNTSGGFTSAAFSFKKEYQLLITPSCTSVNPNQILNCAGVSAIETSAPGNPKAWYALTGAYDEGCFFATLDSLGSPINYKAYTFPYINPFSNVKTYITESVSSPGEYYITGTHDSTVFVLNVNASGNVLWSNYYHSGTAFFNASGIMDCPFTGDILVIGSVNPPAPWSTGTDGFILRLDRNNGNVNFYKTYTMKSGACQLFTSIKPSYSNTGGQGYIIGGSTDIYPALPWMLKVGVGGNIIWTTVIMPSSDPGASTVTDVIERSIGSTYEYYGSIRSNVAGMIVVKLNDNGSPMATVNNEFVFNTTASVVASSCNLDFENPGPNIALTSYGTVDQVNGGEMYMVRSYFNGKSGCNETGTVVSNYYAGPDTVITPWIMKYGSLTACNMFSIAETTVTNLAVVLCSSTVIAGGSNSGVATAIKELYEDDNGVKVVPNPTDGIAGLNFELRAKAKVEISILNSLGQNLKIVLDSELENGKYKAVIDLDELKIPNGMYFIRFNTEGESRSYKVIYTK